MGYIVKLEMKQDRSRKGKIPIKFQFFNSYLLLPIFYVRVLKFLRDFKINQIHVNFITTVESLHCEESTYYTYTFRVTNHMFLHLLFIKFYIIFYSVYIFLISILPDDHVAQSELRISYEFGDQPAKMSWDLTESSFGTNSKKIDTTRTTGPRIFLRSESIGAAYDASGGS